MRWELWDGRTGELLKTFQTDVGALRAAWKLEQEGSIGWAGDLILRGEDGGRRWVIAQGQELRKRAFRAQ